MLSTIYIKGFKTFARPVRMPLTEGITAIVGPNGSGKSNITDAVLFALGEGSPGLLRAGSMGDLIFSGSDSLPAAGAAEVTLVLDNTQGRISLPYEEVSLMRRVSRDGDTEYRVNGVRARLVDVRAVAGEAGLGRHSILRQGAVDAIVAGGAAACRSALEEAAGLGVFRRRRLAASRKLEKASARLESSRQLEVEISAQLCRIEAEAAAAREYRQLEARYRNLSLACLYRVATCNLDERRRRLTGLEEESDALAARQETLREEAGQLKGEEKELETRLSEVEKVLRELENSSESLRAETLRAERASLRPVVVRDPRMSLSRLVSRVEAELRETTSQVRRFEEAASKFEEEHSLKKQSFKDLEQRAKEKRATNEAAASRRTQLERRLEALREKRERLAGWLRKPATLGAEALKRLEEIQKELVARSSDEQRGWSREVLGRIEELRVLASRKAAEANRRQGWLAALVGRTEAEIQALRASVRGAPGGKRLYEILRPRPGYEAAVEAALGDLSTGVLVNNLDEGLEYLSGEDPAERLVVRLDAEAAPKNGTFPGERLLDCVEILDASYAEALKRLLGGSYVLERDHRETLKSGYDIAVTRDGLRFTRTSASRRSPEGEFVRQSRLRGEEECLDALKNRVGEQLYDLREKIYEAVSSLDEWTARVEALVARTSRLARVTRLLGSEVARRIRRAEHVRERRAADEAQLRDADTQIGAIEDELREARRTEDCTEEDLTAILVAAEAEYAAARETAAELARARTNLHNARDRQDRLSEGLNSLRGATTASAYTSLPDLANRVVQNARSLDVAARGHLSRMRKTRSEISGIQALTRARHLELAGEASDVTSRLAEARSEAVALGNELARAEEAARAAETEILDEWGASLDVARVAAGTLPATADDERERARLARRLKNFGDVNLLAMSQESELRERCEFVAAQRSDAEEAATEIKRIIQGVDGEIESRFKGIFREVRRAFGQMVPRMLHGGEGELSLTEEGVEIGIKLKSRGRRPLRVLSGGERSLLALAFLFSVFLGRYSTGPEGTFCMLDEAEAALDDVNLARFLTVVDSYRTNGQFLLVTHQKRTMAAADVLYGITQDSTGATVVVSKRLAGDKG